MSFDKIFDLTAGVHFNFYNIVLGVRDSTELRIWQLRIPGSSSEKNKKESYTTWYGLISDRWSLIGRGSYMK